MRLNIKSFDISQMPNPQWDKDKIDKIQEITALYFVLYMKRQHQ